MLAGQVYEAKHPTDGNTIMVCLNSLNPCHIKYGHKGALVKYGYIDTTTHSLILPTPHNEKFTDVKLVTYPCVDIKLINGALYNIIFEGKTVNVFKVIDAEQKVIELKMPIGGSKQKIIDTTTGQIYNTKTIEHKNEIICIKDELCLFMPSVIVPAFDRKIKTVYQGTIVNSGSALGSKYLYGTRKFECVEDLIPTLMRDTEYGTYFYIGANNEVFTAEYCSVAALCGTASAYDIGKNIGTLTDCSIVPTFNSLMSYKFIDDKKILSVRCMDMVKFKDADDNIVHIEGGSVWPSKVTKFTTATGTIVVKTFIDRTKKIMDIGFVLND